MFFMTMRPCTGVHGVQIVDQGLHRLVGGTVGLLHRAVVGELLALTGGGFVHAVGLHQVGQFGCVEVLAVFQLGIQAGLGLQLHQLIIQRVPFLVRQYLNHLPWFRLVRQHAF